jgi:hypothetical protein
MAEIHISDGLHVRMLRFKDVIEAVIDEEIDFAVYPELLLAHGIDSMLADLLSPLDHDTLLKSIQQLGSQYPADVYGYVAETLKRGASVELRERVRRQLGFHRPPEDPGLKD